MLPTDLVRPAPYGVVGEPFIDPNTRALVVTRHADMDAVMAWEKAGRLSQDETFLRDSLVMAGVPDLPQEFHIDWAFPWAQGDVRADGSPGRWRAMQTILVRHLHAQMAARMAPTIDRLALGLLRENVAQQLTNGTDTGSLELPQFATALTFRVISELAGFPVSAEATMRRHFDEIARADFFTALRMDDTEVRESISAIIDEHQGGGLLGSIKAAYEAGRITRRERDGLVWGCWISGTDTTATLISLIFGMLQEVYGGIPGNLREIREEVIEEALRLGTPFAWMYFIATRDLEIFGHRIPRLGQVHVQFATANRDPAVFDDPNEFRLGRPNIGKHRSFGGGLHACIGASLARSEARIVMDLVRRHLPSLRVHLGGWERSMSLIDVVTAAPATYDLQAAARSLEVEA